MTPYEHAILSVRDFGGIPEDYLEIHEFLDSTKAHVPNWRHRMILHNSWGMLLVEKICGPMVINYDDKIVSTREIARRHIEQDLGGPVPTLENWFKHVKFDVPINTPNGKDLKYLKKHAFDIATKGGPPPVKSGAYFTVKETFQGHGHPKDNGPGSE